MDTTSDFTANFDKENSKGEAPELGLSEGAKELGGSGTKPVSGDEDVENKINEFITKYLIKPEFKGYKLDRYKYRQCPDRLGYNIFLVITKETH